MHPRVILRKGRVKPTAHRHPWVFPGSIDRIEGEPGAGGVVCVCDPEGRFLGRGFYNPVSRIRVRIWSFEPEEELDDRLIRARLEDAIELRRSLRLEPATNAFRVVHAEGDGMPGLVVDRFGDRLVLQVGSLALHQRLERLLDPLVAAYRPAAIYRRDDPRVARWEGMEPVTGCLRRERPPADPLLVREDGRLYEVDLHAGQKTGFFLDQRENRRRVAALAAGRRVLDAFSYTGGFAIACARAGAAEVVAVESARGPVATLERNLRHNGLGDSIVRVRRDDVYRFLSREAGPERFDLTIIDPPPYVRRRAERRKGMQKYVELNRLAISATRRGGLLFTCSCSGALEEALFEEVLKEAAARAGRFLRVLERYGQPADHPVAVTAPEGRYLKAWLCRV